MSSPDEEVVESMLVVLPMEKDLPFGLPFHHVETNINLIRNKTNDYG